MLWRLKLVRQGLRSFRLWQFGTLVSIGSKGLSTSRVVRIFLAQVLFGVLRFTARVQVFRVPVCQA